MLVDTDVCFCVVFVWEATGVPRGNPPAQPGDHMIGLSSIAHSVSIHRPCQYRRYSDILKETKKTRELRM